MNQQLDPIDTIATKAFEGYVVRKDLVRKFKGQYPVPTYVAEFLLGRYCASVDEEEIAEGLKIVERQLGEKTIRAGEHELFKARAKEKGHVKLIDIITARLDAGSDSFLATLPSLQLKDVRISEAMVHGNERMLTGGFYAEVGHLFGPLPPEMRDDTAFMDRIHAYLPGWDLPKVHRDLLTNHFGLVSDFLSECWNQLRRQSRQNIFQGRIHLGGALSGRDTTGVQKTVSGLIKLVSPNPEIPVSDEVLEWALRLALECRRRVKEQQKRIGSAEFRNTQFSYSMGEDGVEKFVSTPELYSENSIGSDPLPPGQVWVISAGGGDENPGLYQVDITEGPGSGVKILNQPAPPPFRESVRCAEQNLYARAKELVGDREPRQHEFSVQLRAFDSAKTGSAVGIGVLLAMCSSLLQKSIKGGLAVTGGLNLGGSLETIFNPVAVVETAIEKGAVSILMPISSRRQLNDLPDDLAARITIHYYLDARDALLKALAI